MPTLWIYEIANVLALLVHRKRIETERADNIAIALDALHVVTVSPDGAAWRVLTAALVTASGGL